LFVLFSLALPLSDAHADSKKCLASKFIAKAWLPALDSSDGIVAVQKWPKDAIIKIRIILDERITKDYEIWKIEQIKSQITNLFHLANLGVSFFDKGDADYVLILTTDVEGYISKQFGYLRDFRRLCT
jgi:citrate lyase gamma subunit